jgi:hypothetical protein
MPTVTFPIVDQSPCLTLDAIRDAALIRRMLRCRLVTDVATYLIPNACDLERDDATEESHKEAA